MTKILTLLFLYTSSTLWGQFVEAGIGSDEFLAWKRDSTYVVLSSSDSAYNRAIQKYMTEVWTFNPVKFIPQQKIEDENYRDAHEEKMVLQVVALSGAGPAANNIKARKPEDGAIALTLFRMEELGSIGFGTPDIFVPVRKCFAYFSFLRKRGFAGLKATTKTVYVTDFEENPLHLQVPLAMQYLENLAFLRQAISDKKYLFSGSFIKDIKDMINHPKHLRRKTLVLMDVHLKDMEEEDIRKALGRRYEIVSPEKYHQILADKNPNYAAVTARVTRLGYLVTVIDLELGRMVYAHFGWGAHLKKKHLEELKEAIREGKV